MRIGTRMKHGKWNADDPVRTGQARVGRMDTDIKIGGG